MPQIYSIFLFWLENKQKYIVPPHTFVTLNPYSLLPAREQRQPELKRVLTLLCFVEYLHAWEIRHNHNVFQSLYGCMVKTLMSMNQIKG